MTNLTAATPRTFRGPMSRATYGAAGAIFEGSLVQLDAAGAIVNASGDGTTFAGIADGSASAAADRVTVVDEGTAKLAGVVKGSTWTLGDVGDVVYAGDGNAFTTVSSGAQAVGRVVEVESFAGTAATCWVKFQSLAMRDPA